MGSLFVVVVGYVRLKERGWNFFHFFSANVRKCSQVFRIKIYCLLFCNLQTFKKPALRQTASEDKACPEAGSLL